MIDILVISISNPLLIGLYKEGVLVKTYEIDGKTSDELPKLVDEILSESELNHIYYVNSPGSYMAIKVAYVFLKTLSITKKIPFFATHGFHFNGNSPIKALGKKYFMLQDEETIIDFIDESVEIKPFILPKNLQKQIFTEETLPIYNLPAV